MNTVKSIEYIRVEGELFFLGKLTYNISRKRRVQKLIRLKHTLGIRS